MIFRVRPGFRLFRTVDESLEFEALGGRSGVRPLAQGGDVKEFPLQFLAELRRRDVLGALEPCDDEAREYYGTTVPKVSRRVTNPEIYVKPEQSYSPFWKSS